MKHAIEEIQFRQPRHIKTILPHKQPNGKQSFGDLNTGVSNNNAFGVACIILIVPRNFITKSIRV